jgi:alkylated DNA repair dioxygenase AlkB
VDDATGRVAYTPGVLDPATANEWFAAVREGVPWKAERRRMYDRDVDVPRLTAHYRLRPGDPPPPDVLRRAADLVLGRTGVPFNSVGLNFYRDGRDSVAPHTTTSTSSSPASRSPSCPSAARAA